MKCSQCYADNSPWATVCTRCGQSVLRLETCPNGHLLPPGVQSCPICPSLWPQAEPFAGAPLLRGLLCVQSGRLAMAASPEVELGYLELRDREAPIELSLKPNGVVQVLKEGDGEAQCRILARPDGPQVCNKSRVRQPSAPLAYTKLPPGGSFDLGVTTFRYLELELPAWVEKLALSLSEDT